jgi:hypothetical protein
VIVVVERRGDGGLGTNVLQKFFDASSQRVFSLDRGAWRQVEINLISRCSTDIVQQISEVVPRLQFHLSIRRGHCVVMMRQGEGSVLTTGKGFGVGTWPTGWHGAGVGYGSVERGAWRGTSDLGLSNAWQR